MDCVTWFCWNRDFVAFFSFLPEATMVTEVSYILICNDWVFLLKQIKMLWMFYSAILQCCGVEH